MSATEAHADAMFGYTCEQCLGLVFLTDADAELYRHPDGWLRICCDDCLQAYRLEQRQRKARA